MAGEKLNLLIVDDEPLVLSALRSEYRKRYNVTTSGSSKETLAMIKREPQKFQILLCDQRLPGKLGLDLLKEINELNPKIRSVLLSGQMNTALFKQMSESGYITGFVSKPWDPQELANELAAAAKSYLLSLKAGFDPTQPFVLDRVEIKNFKSIEHLELKLDRGSPLGGPWTCLAGINGVGKSAVLEAICFLLLGSKRIPQIPQKRIQDLYRKRVGEVYPPELAGYLKQGDQEYRLWLPFGPKELDEKRLKSADDADEMENTWEALERVFFVSYGASRNLSGRFDTKYADFNEMIHRQMTLFDPMTQVAGIRALLGDREILPPCRKTIDKLLTMMLEPFDIKADTHAGQEGLSGGISFGTRDAAVLRHLDLPDGFRALFTWLADMCLAWHDLHPSLQEEQCHPKNIRGIVLLDEIDLHLHASFQRRIIPDLRRALPNVQWIVTTHSALVLPSFDRSEVYLLRTEKDEGVVAEELDSQIMGFSSDQVLEWLLETKPRASFLEDQLQLLDRVERGEVVTEFRLEAETLADLLEQSPRRGENAGSWKERIRGGYTDSES